MRTWLEGYLQKYGEDILEDVTTAMTTLQYSKHWKAVIPIEVREMVSSSITEMLPKCKENPELCFVDDLAPEDFISCTIETVTPTKGLVNLTCRSTSPLLNRRIARELQGGTICAAYIKGKNKCTNLLIVICRRVSWEDEDINPYCHEATIDMIELHLIVSRNRIRDAGVWPECILHLLHLCHFSPWLRAFKAVEECSNLPSHIQNTLFGDQGPYRMTDPDVTNGAIDSGCGTYLDGLKSSNAQLDDPQLQALRSVLANVGSCNIASSSFSLIHGPPGTGKTTTIIHLIGALLHHSTVGHVGHEQRHPLKRFMPTEHIQRCRDKSGGIRILVCASSNKGIDNILQRIHEDGIPDGKGGSFWPQLARIGRAGYDYKEFYMYSVDKKALPFDQYIHNVGASRNTASSKARKSFFEECILVLTTLVSSGGAKFKNIKVPFDVVITDELGQACEPDTLIPMTNIMKRSHRCHFVGVGDHVQLPPISLASHAVKCMKFDLKFDFDRQMQSIFQRLHSHNRAPSRMLTIQYRMCRAVADMNNKIFYDGKLESVLPETSFDAPYNMGWNPESGCFSRQTIIDTSLLPGRMEIQTSDTGDYRNIEEISIVDEVLHKIKLLSEDSFHTLRDQIAVLVPYRSQVEETRLVLERYGKYRENGVSRLGFDILVDTVDSMQGSEKDIVVFAQPEVTGTRISGF